MRTTSLVESINSVLQRSFPDPTQIFKFIEQLKLFDTIKSTDLHQISTGLIIKSSLQQKRAADRKRDEQIQQCTNDLKSNAISVGKFLEQVSIKDVLPPVKKL